MTDNAGYRPTDDSALRWEDDHCTKCGERDNVCKCARTSKTESNRDKALRGEVVLVTKGRLREMQLQASALEGVGEGAYHWHWSAVLNELIARRSGALPAHETTAEPARVLQWAVDSFGEIARNRDERAARLAEEAMEVAQAEGVPLETLKRIADRIYSRPLGELGQEVGGLGITLYALAANCGLDLFGEIEREWKRVLSKPRDWWQRKHAEKVAAGTADLTPITPEEPSPVQCAYTYDVVAYNESWGGYGDNASREGFKTAEEAITYAKSCAAHLNAMAFKRTIPIPVERVSVQIYPPENGGDEHGA